ncbi:MAG TPA: DUF6089 family protein [Chitinophagaceae bacterium]
MRIKLLLLLLVVTTVNSHAQRLHLGLFGGLAAYNGDLTEKIFPKKVTNGAIGLTANYELKDQVMLRAGFTYAVVGGADRFSDNEELIKRNLSFETQLWEFSVIGEYYVFNLYDRRYSPYIFGGLALYHYNPYAYNGTDEKIYLKPLSTEGQGLLGYEGREAYSLTQIALPFGGGIKFAVNDNLRIGLEGGLRKLFTDHFDDVSTTYADPNDLLAARGQLAVDMSYRGDEVPTGDPNYPQKGAQRGGEKNKDYYYFTGLHITYRLGGGGGNGARGGGKSKTGCPVNVY